MVSDSAIGFLFGTYRLVSGSAIGLCMWKISVNGKLVKTVLFIWIMNVGKVSNTSRLRWKGEPETPTDKAADSRVRFYCHNTEP